MIDPLAAAITVTALGCAVVVVAQAMAGGLRVHRVGPGLVVLEAAVALQALFDLVALARGHRPAQPSTHLAYVVTSVLVLPAAWSQVRGDAGRWAALLLAVALVVLAVLVVRLATTWRSAGA